MSLPPLLRTSPLRVRAYLFLIAVSLLSSGVMFIVDTGAIRDVRGLADERLEQQTARAASSVLTQVVAIQTSLKRADALVASGTPFERLCESVEPDPQFAFERLFVLDLDANLYCATIPTPSYDPAAVLNRPYFQAVRVSGEDQIGGPLIGIHSGVASLTLAHPIRVGAMSVAVVVASKDVGDLVFAAQTVSGAERVILLGEDGGAYEVGEPVAPVLPEGVMAAVQRARQTGGTCAAQMVDGWVWSCSADRGTGLITLLANPESVVYRSANALVWHSRWRYLGAWAVGLIAIAAGDLFFLRRVRRIHREAGLSPASAGAWVVRDEVDDLSDWVRSARRELAGLRDLNGTSEVRREQFDREMLTLIAQTVEARYPFLRHHGDRVGRYSRLIGTRLGIDGLDLDHLEFAARIHDIGKIVIADSIYLKPGPFDPIELVQMQLHSTRGAELIERMHEIPTEVAEAVLHHHERWDGEGYPAGLAGTAIPLWSRIIAVADAYDAMTEERPYRAHPRSHAEALAELRAGMGKQWDATCVTAFLEVVESGALQAKTAMAAPPPEGDGAAG